ncbi:UDP-N-acetylmuramoylalanine--D-glutamate ligase [Gossypium arboreum]|uniref:UDP-N-acetylmuramoylalanine--D-glutamate ligase n=1 Tax=Gossypium arboreum TaxID=29729 RepID=A0A0B0P3D9_GOSAR|nr:UDP-N-acetylmuramoylalanine--D-glutamate ligase [Gossypium arboreum]
MDARDSFPLTRVIDFRNVSTSTHSRCVITTLILLLINSQSFAVILVCWLGGSIDIPTGVLVGKGGVLAGNP